MASTATTIQGGGQQAATATTVVGGGKLAFTATIPGGGSGQGAGGTPPPWLWLGAFGGILALGFLASSLVGKKPPLSVYYNPKDIEIDKPKSWGKGHHDDDLPPLEYDEAPPGTAPNDGENGQSGSGRHIKK